MLKGRFIMQTFTIKRGRRNRTVTLTECLSSHQTPWMKPGTIKLTILAVVPDETGEKLKFDTESIVGVIPVNKLVAWALKEKHLRWTGKGGSR